MSITKKLPRKKKAAKKSDLYFATVTDIATHYEVSITMAQRWQRENAKDFPKETQQGYDRKQVDKFLEDHNYGPYGRFARNGNGRIPPTVTWTEARIKETLERAELQRIKKEDAEINLEVKRGKILLADDVLETHKRIASTVLTIFEQIPDSIAREIGGEVPANVRIRITNATARILRDGLGAVEEFLREESEAAKKSDFRKPGSGIEPRRGRPRKRKKKG